MQTVYSIFSDSEINILKTKGENQNLEIRCGSLSCLFFSHVNNIKISILPLRKLFQKYTNAIILKKKTFASTRADTEVSSEIRKSYSTTKVGIKLLIFQVQSNREISKKNTLWV